MIVARLTCSSWLSCMTCRTNLKILGFVAAGYLSALAIIADRNESAKALSHGDILINRRRISCIIGLAKNSNKAIAMESPKAIAFCLFEQFWVLE